MSLFSRGRQHSLYSFRLAALLAHLLDLLSEVLLLHLRQLVSVEVPGHVDAEVPGGYPLQLGELEAGVHSPQLTGVSSTRWDRHRQVSLSVCDSLLLSRKTGSRLWTTIGRSTYNLYTWKQVHFCVRLRYIISGRLVTVPVLKWKRAPGFSHVVCASKNKKGPSQKQNATTMTT